MQLAVIGPGCERCKLLAQLTEQAAQELGVPYELKKVTELKEMMSFGVMLTPALAVDGRVRLSGKVPSVAEIKKFLV